MVSVCHANAFFELPHQREIKLAIEAIWAEWVANGIIVVRSGERFTEQIDTRIEGFYTLVYFTRKVSCMT